MGADSSRLAWLILLLVVAGIGVWAYWHGESGRRSGRSTAAACGAPLPNLHGDALAMAKSAQFLTVEQFSHLAAPRSGKAYRVQAKLLQYSADGQQYRLRLGSLEHPGVTLTATVPAGRCVSNKDDAALYDELREDFNLQFGPLTAQAAAPAQPPQVVVTGIASTGPNGLELRPVLDFQVQ